MNLKKRLMVVLAVAGLAWAPRACPESNRKDAEQLREPTVTGEEAELLQRAIELADRDPAAALAALSEEVTDESSAALDFTLGSLKLRQDDLEGAEASYRSALSKLPSFDRARACLGRALIMQGKIEEARRVFDPVLLNGEASPEILTLVGYTFLLQDQSVPAETAYRQALLLDPSDDDAWLGLAKCLLDQGRYRESTRLLENVLERNPYRPELWFLSANADMALEKPEEAIVRLECARRLGIASAEALATLGDLYVNRGQTEDALSAYEEAFRGAGSSPDRLLRAAEGLLMTNAPSPAAVLIERARELEKDDPVSFQPVQRRRLLRLEAELARATGDLPSAFTLYRSLLEEDPLDGDVLLALGELHREQGEWEEASIFYERAARIAGREAEALLKQAQVEVERGGYGKAVELLEAAQVFDPQPRVARYLEQVRRLVR